MLIPSSSSISVPRFLKLIKNANSQLHDRVHHLMPKLIKKGEC